MKYTYKIKFELESDKEQSDIVTILKEAFIDDEKSEIEISKIVQLDNDWTVEKGLKELAEKMAIVKEAIEKGWEFDLKAAWEERLETIHDSMQEDTGYFVGNYEDDYPTDQEKFGEVNVYDLADMWLNYNEEGE
jgi:hypothetical protein